MHILQLVAHGVKYLIDIELNDKRLFDDHQTIKNFNRDLPLWF